MSRKQHSGDSGYIAERMNPFAPGTKVVIYRAEEQALDVGDSKYAVVCDAHSTLVGEASVPKARLSMKRPDNFCEACSVIERGPAPQRKHHLEAHGTSVRPHYVPMPGPDHPGGPGWVVVLCNQDGFWIYDRWVTRSTDIDRVIDDVLYGIDTGIIEIDNGPVITLVEVR